jgi:hypothetical protein
MAPVAVGDSKRVNLSSEVWARVDREVDEAIGRMNALEPKNITGSLTYRQTMIVRLIEKAGRPLCVREIGDALNRSYVNDLYIQMRRLVARGILKQTTVKGIQFYSITNKDWKKMAGGLIQ